MSVEGPIVVAVVGHANTGKTSMLQTLLRRRDFGTVSPHGGTTRTVEAGDIAFGSDVVARILDTPGLEESSRLRDLLDAQRNHRGDDARTLLDRVLALPDCGDGGELELEASALRAAGEADVLLYAIDARETPRPRHLDELDVLAATARPLVPLLNFVARPEAEAAAWRDACARRGLHATIAFDAVVYDDASEHRLLEAMRTLVPDRTATIDRWIAGRDESRRAARRAASDVVADWLVDVAAATIVTAATPRDDRSRRSVFEEASHALIGRLREAETEMRAAVASCSGFRGEEAISATLEIVDAIGGVDFTGAASLERAGLWAAGGGAGLLAAGVVADAAVGGVSLGGFTALGAAGAALGAAGATGGKILRRWRGQQEVRLGDEGVDLLVRRALATMLAFERRGHAAIEPMRIDDVVADVLKRSTPSDITDGCRAARRRPGWSRLSEPPGVGGGLASRGDAVARLAKAIVADDIRPASR